MSILQLGRLPSLKALFLQGKYTCCWLFVYVTCTKSEMFKMSTFLTCTQNACFRLLMFHILGNEISRVEGLEGLQDLRELVLDRNRIKSLTELSLTSQWNLQVTPDINNTNNSDLVIIPLSGFDSH